MENDSRKSWLVRQDYRPTEINTSLLEFYNAIENILRAPVRIENSRVPHEHASNASKRRQKQLFESRGQQKTKVMPVFPPYSNSRIDLTKLWIDKAKDNMERITRNLSYIKKILQSIV